MHREGGFSLVEVMVATFIMLVVTAGVFSVMNPSQGTFSQQPEVADLQQRLRIGIDALYRDLVMSGGGTYMGTDAGPFLHFFAPISTYRQGVLGPDVPTPKSDTLTVLYVPPGAPQTVLKKALPQPSSDLEVEDVPGCPQHNALCGFEPAQTVIIYDSSGAYDLFVVSNVQGTVGHLQHNQNSLSAPAGYAKGATIALVQSRTYYLDTATRQLMVYDGGNGADVPVVDHVVGVTFEYYADPLPPTRTKKLLTEPGPWTTYGPTPNALGVPSGTSWPAGENCAFLVDPATGLHASRLPALGAGTPTLVKMTPVELTDGPYWCPDAANPNRFDADLLRVRKIGVTLRMEAAVAMFRGPASALFINGGTSSSYTRWIPDQEIQFQVTPRNLNLSR